MYIATYAAKKLSSFGTGKLGKKARTLKGSKVFIAKGHMSTQHFSRKML